jgi:putative transposase
MVLGTLLEMPPVTRIDLRGPAAAFVTTTVTNWQPVFSKRETADLVILTLDETVKKFGISVCGYVLMPSHLHLLAGFPQIEKMSLIIGSFKSLTSRRIRERMREQEQSHFLLSGEFKLWKRRFDDVIIVSERQFRIKLDYIHNNPVKAGLVDSADEYVYSSAADWTGSGNGAIEVIKDWRWT